MFEKILATLPYNPGMAHQLAFYGRRMHEEAAIRRIGVVFMLLAFFIQFFAVLSPPQSTIAASANDLVRGGVHRHGSVSNADAAGDACHNDVQDFKKILAEFGISCGAVGKGTYVSNLSSSAADYYSMGRVPYDRGNETPINIAGAGKLYFRQLNSFGASSYEAIKVENDTGKTFWILLDCGNLVAEGLPTPTLEQVFVKETPTLPPATQTPTTTTTTDVQTPMCDLNPALPADSPLCKRCIYNGNILVSDAACKPTETPMCDLNPALPVDSPLCKRCIYNGNILVGDAACKPAQEVCALKPSLPKDSPLCKECPYSNTLLESDAACKSCEDSKNNQDNAACTRISKTASNLTANVTDANNTTAAAGDVIKYSLHAKNTGKGTIKDFVFSENLNDVLDYADITDLHGAGIDNNTKIVTWPSVTIKPGETATVNVTVKIKNPIPQTPVGASNPGQYDLVMTNVYGNAINIKLPGSPAKSVQTVAATLPNTGPGENLAVAAIIVIAAGYFYGRARLLSKESDIALKEIASA